MSSQSRLLLVLALPAATAPVVTLAAELRSEPPHVHATRLSKAPVIDGKLDEPVWQDAALITDFKQIKPGDGAPASERTEVRVGFDKDNLYIGAHMVDRRGPGAITASVMKQGSRLPDDDRLGIILDPFGTGRGAYRFEVNLNGVRNDMLYQGGQPQGEWTVIWDAAASLTEDGWSAEIALPFKTLPFDPNVKAWGFNVNRAIRGRAEEAVWVSRNRAWGPTITGLLTGIEGVDRGLGLDIVPTLGLRSMRYYATDRTDKEANPSLDLYYRLTPSLNASLTLNTDFSATDADDRQVNLTRFNLFFPEKRDFFLKDADLFDFGRIGGSGDSSFQPRSGTRSARESGRPFFSRKLGLSPVGTPVDLNYGGKLSGRMGRWRIGMLTVRQDDFVPTSGSNIDASTVGVARIAADVLSESSVGMVATFGDPGTNSSNSLVGADFLFQNTRFPGGRTLEAEGWVQHSDSNTAVGNQNAFGFGARLIDTAGLRYGASFKQIGRGFRPALGFVSRAGIRAFNADGGYTNLVRGSLVQSVFTGLDVERIEDVNGTLQSQALALRPIEMESSRRDVLKLYYMFNTEVLATPFTIFSNVNKRVVIPVGRYPFQDYGFDFTTGQQRRLGTKVNFRRGEFYDGKRLAMGGEVSWKQSKHFAVRGSYDFNDITLPAGKFSTRILSAGVDINFSSRMFWTNLFQYDNVSEVAGFQSHLHYIPKAGQEFNLIVNKASEDLDRDGHFRSLTTEYGARLSYTLRF
jgi:Domain of unknown function (DUF5916)/Carbohydrate family 9 binding domain-like